MRHLVIAVERAIADGNHHAALALALTLPDICGRIDDASAKVGDRYSAWFNRYMAHCYVHHVGPLHIRHEFLTGADFYALRCAVLHEGRDQITEQRARKVLERFMFVVPPPGAEVHNTQYGAMLQLQVDVFCRQLLSGVEQWLTEAEADPARSAKLGQLLRIRTIDGRPLPDRA
jgi:hypothetical protein